VIEILDTLVEKFPQIIISNEDKNGKAYKNTRWFFPKDKERYHNVFIEVWDHPQKKVVDVVLYRYMMTPIENALAEFDGNDRDNSKRGKLILHDIDGKDLFDFISAKVDKYCSNSDL